MTEKSMADYEAPTVTLYGDIASLTESVALQPSTDALCTGLGTPIAGVPSNTVCKAIP